MTYSVDVYNKEGKIVSKVDLNSEIFSDEKVNTETIDETNVNYIIIYNSSISN